jgi:uncharacterized protein with HEPN domain
LASFTSSKQKEDYLADQMRQAAVERQFITIGEALSRASREDAYIAQRITGAARIISFRNRLVHGYSQISAETVWSIVQEYFPPLHAEVQDLILEIQNLPGEVD